MSNKVFEHGPMARWLSTLGGAITIVYVVGMAYLIDGRLDELRCLKLNELGDFLAGVFGPLAVFWLVLGYFQQGIELRHSSDALRLQASELANSVAQQQKLVEVTTQQVNAEINDARESRERRNYAARPKWVVSTHPQLNQTLRRSFLSFALRNVGQDATSVELHCDNGGVRPIEHWPSNEDRSFTFNFASEDAMDHFALVISYVDSIGNEGVDEYLIAYEQIGTEHQLRLRAVSRHVAPNPEP